MFRSNSISHEPQDIRAGPNSAARKVDWRINNADWYRFTAVIGRRIKHLATDIDNPDSTHTAQQLIDRRWAQLRDIIVETAHEVVGVKKHGTARDRWWSYPDVNMHAVYNKVRATMRRARRQLRTQEDYNCEERPETNGERCTSRTAVGLARTL